MRADRLLSILMLLQSRGRMTARNLADELEVSERTIYRDLEALGMAGVPVYAERGPGGGCALLDSYRTNLTGLSAPELQALFSVSIPGPLAELGLQQDFQTALLKLSASLPSSRRSQEESVRGRIHLDWEGWNAARQPVPFLETVHQAVRSDRQLRIRYRLYFGMETEKIVHPLGLVAKTGEWFLVCTHDGQIRVHGIADLLHAEIYPEPSCRPERFNLEEFWQGYCRNLEKNRKSYSVRLLVQAGAIPELERITGQKIEPALPEKKTDFDQSGGSPAEISPLEVLLLFRSLKHARSQLMSLGAAVEVLEPEALRLSLADFADQICRLYKQNAEN